jgi:predicted Zn-dependent protease
MTRRPAIAFTETSNQCCDSQADFYAEDYGSTGWRGVAVQRLSDGSGAVACVGCAPFTDWDYTELSMNDNYLKHDCCVTRIQNTAAHEFGHGIALSHSSVTSALMYFSISNYDTYGVYTPQEDDDIDFADELD